MLYYFKIGGRRIAYRKETDEAIRLSALAGQMLEQLSFPLSSTCPSSLRYAFAKYDSEEIRGAYDEVLALASETPPEPVVFPMPAETMSVCLTVNGNDCEADCLEKEWSAAKACDAAPLLSFAESPGKEVPTAEKLARMTAFLEKTVKEEIRASRTGSKSSSFAETVSAVHTDPRCRNCFAEHHCPLAAPTHPGCTLACLFAECFLATADVKNRKTNGYPRIF